MPNFSPKRSSGYPIFYDPHHRRWHRFKSVCQFLFLGAVIFLSFFLVAVSINPKLPSLGLSPFHGLYNIHHNLTIQQKVLSRQWQDKFFGDRVNHSQNSLVSSTIPTQTLPPERMGFYVNWDDNSFTSLKQNINSLDKLMPEWLHLSQADGSIIIDDIVKQKRTLDYIHNHRPDLPISPLINNYDSKLQNWNSKTLIQVLNNVSARHSLVQNLLKFVQENGFNGINIDFENLESKNLSDLTLLMTELYQTFHPLGLEVSQSVPIDDPAFDYRSLAKVNDYLILMAYDEHYSGGEPGAIASQKWFAQKLRQRFAEVPASHYIVALGNYGYDWRDNKAPASEITFQEAIKLAQDSHGKIQLDPVSLNQTFTYSDDQDRPHQVWFLDGVTAFNQAVEAKRQGVRGYVLWRMGAEDPSFWDIFKYPQHFDAATASQLQTIQYGYDIDYEGQGEILKVISTPKTGQRKLTYDAKLGLIVQEKFLTYPSSYGIARWGNSDRKKIALTFDDGPDVKYTPQILEILKRYKVPATFFVIGMNASEHPDLLKQMVAEGHEIGSHTFTHPNIAKTSHEQLELELNATERLLQSYLGRSSVLFRPPYAEDVEPETPDQVAPIQFTGSLGYYTIGMQIDPLDWRNPGSDRIVQATLKQVKQKLGNIVLLHDSGGDRAQTVAALPKIIEGLQSEGYQLVAVSDLMGLSHDAVMPPVAKNEAALTDVSRVGFWVWENFNQVLYTLFVVGIGLSVARLLFIAILAIYEHYLRQKRIFVPDYEPFVTVLVAAYNEEKVISKTIGSILRASYGRFNVVVVDDGSKDGTFQRIKADFGDNPQVKLLTKANGGKSDALNYGLRQIEADLVITIDADTVLAPSAIAKLVRHFVDPQLGAVAGNAKVGNRHNIMTYWQALEYITSQNLERRAFGRLNCICVVPGAIGAWRREVILKAGGFINDTLAEDTDLTLTVLEMGYRIDYEENAIAWTEAPDTIGGFLQQRFRWMYGTFQALWKRRSMLFRSKYGSIGLFALPNVLIFQIAFPLISPIMDLVTVVAIAWTIWQQNEHPDSFSPDALAHVFVYYLLFLAVDLLAAAIAFALEPKEDWKLAFWLFPQRFFYRQLMYYVAVKAILKALQGQLVGWGKLERKATVSDLH